VMALRDAGWRIVNLACGLGRAADRDRRRAELIEACARAGFELRLPPGLHPFGRHDDLAAAQSAIAVAIASAARELDAVLIAAPSPHDGHHGHEVVGRAIVEAVESMGAPARVAFWGLWGELPAPNVLVPFGEARLAEVGHALAAHVGELQRNRFDVLLGARAAANAVLGPERVFGFGAHAAPGPYAELLTLVGWDPERGWRLAVPRALDPSRPLEVCDLGALEGAPEIGWWLHEPSVRSRLGQSLRRAPSCSPCAL
jgi:hypothetical protein